MQNKKDKKMKTSSFKTASGSHKKAQKNSVQVQWMLLNYLCTIGKYLPKVYIFFLSNCKNFTLKLLQSECEFHFEGENSYLHMPLTCLELSYNCLKSPKSEIYCYPKIQN